MGGLVGSGVRDGQWVLGVNEKKQLRVDVACSWTRRHQGFWPCLYLNNIYKHCRYVQNLIVRVKIVAHTRGHVAACKRQFPASLLTIIGANNNTTHLQMRVTRR